MGLEEKLSPKEMLERTRKLLETVKQVKELAVFVGLPSEKAGDKIYKGGQSIMTVGATHEYGGGHNPERSFLRMPFKEKKDEVGAILVQQFTAVAVGKRDVKTALGRCGVGFVNIVKEAFRTGGFGKWPKLKQATIDRKGFDDILEDTRVLRNSVTWVVRKDEGKKE